VKEVNISLSNIAHCACARCPSFPGRITELIHMDMVTKLFCGHGKAKAEVTQRGCICDECPVFKEHELKGSYFCVNGKAE